MTEEKKKATLRKQGKWWINQLGYLGLRGDVTDRAGLLTMLEDVRDFLKLRYYPSLEAAKKKQAEATFVNPNVKPDPIKEKLRKLGKI